MIEHIGSYLFNVIGSNLNKCIVVRITVTGFYMVYGVGLVVLQLYNIYVKLKCCVLNMAHLFFKHVKSHMNNCYIFLS